MLLHEAVYGSRWSSMGFSLYSTNSTYQSKYDDVNRRKSESLYEIGRPRFCHRNCAGKIWKIFKLKFLNKRQFDTQVPEYQSCLLVSAFIYLFFFSAGENTREQQRNVGGGVRTISGKTRKRNRDGGFGNVGRTSTSHYGFNDGGGKKIYRFFSFAWLHWAYIPFLDQLLSSNRILLNVPSLHTKIIRPHSPVYCFFFINLIYLFFFCEGNISRS